jgi:hypothetical protein
LLYGGLPYRRAHPFIFCRAGIKDLFDEGGLAAAADAADDAEDAQGEFDGNILQVILPGAFDDQRTVPFPNGFGWRDGQLTFEVFARQAVFIGDKLGVITGGHHFTAEVAGQGAHIDDIVCIAHHHFVVFDDHYGIAQIAQFLEHADQPLGIPGMQPDGGLVEDIQRVGQVTAERAGQLDALAFAAAEAIGETR